MDYYTTQGDIKKLLFNNIEHFDAATGVDGPYKKSCTDCSIYKGFITCSCKNIFGAISLTRKQISSCLDKYYMGNSDGNLVCDTSPTYKKTCSDCSIKNNILKCSCKRPYGTPNVTYKNINDCTICKKCMKNNDAKFECEYEK